MNTSQQPTINRVPVVSAARITLMPTIFAIAISVAAMAVPNHASASDQDGSIHQEGGKYWKNSTQTFPLNEDGKFSINNIDGRIEVHGWNSNAVVLVTAIHGESRESVEAIKVNIDSEPNHVDVHTEQPDGKQNKAAVDYTVQVPEHARLKDVSSVNGGIVIDGVSGDITASTVNGETGIKDAGSNLKLNTVNGNITAKMNKLGRGQTVSFNSVNGRVMLSLPENADAKFAVNSLNGGLTSEFPELQAYKEYPLGNKLNGSLGQGSASVRGDSVNGRVEILKHEH